ncbi:UNVERIFIED_CONTAM: hypothetical protein NCL1_28225 [Trichonephila clavipes]
MAALRHNNRYKLVTTRTTLCQTPCSVLSSDSKQLPFATEKTSTCFNSGAGTHSILMVERVHNKSRNSSE